MIAALDISLNTGWALGAGGEITFGTRIFSGYSGDDIRVGRKFRGWVDSFLDQNRPEILLIERPFFKGTCTWLLAGLAWEAQRSAEERGIPRFDYSPMTIKKFMTGNGVAKKPEMVKAVRARGWNVTNDHEADAISLLLLHTEGRRPPVPADLDIPTLPLF